MVVLLVVSQCWHELVIAGRRDVRRLEGRSGLRGSLLLAWWLYVKVPVVVVVWTCGSANLGSHPVLVYQGPRGTTTHSTVLYYSTLLYTTADFTHIHAIAIGTSLHALRDNLLRTFDPSPQSTPNRLPARSLIPHSLTHSHTLSSPLLLDCNVSTE